MTKSDGNKNGPMEELLFPIVKMTAVNIIRFFKYYVDKKYNICDTV